VPGTVELTGFVRHEQRVSVTELN